MELLAGTGIDADPADTDTLDVSVSGERLEREALDLASTAMCLSHGLSHGRDERNRIAAFSVDVNLGIEGIGHGCLALSKR